MKEKKLLCVNNDIYIYVNYVSIKNNFNVLYKFTSGNIISN